MKPVILVRIPSQIGRLYGAGTWEKVEAETVQEVMQALDSRFPGMGERLLEPDGEMRRWVNVFLDGQDIRSLGGVATRLVAGNEVFIVPSVAGGNHSCMSL